ncbi:polysaccharide deacetylase family protein [Halobacterium rubrum]|uniref:polysaccharide deacetylase family protein n=1 Tax=Halobacterium TaxID=2239 RepID=UPI001EFF994E|nr:MULTISPECIES: polysaccharide deacetylase family protein [Halobacterium]MDH5021415.1 polysaccharide deacetylase family protein [Halobacterium rubrum]
MKAVMYHYVRPDVSNAPWYYHLDIEDFRAQLDYFEDEYGFVDRDAFLAAVRGDADLPDGVVLTFDDGLSDHYEWVFPELQRRGLWGIFYVPTSPYTQEKALSVHRVHALVGKYGGDAVLEPLLNVVNEEMVPDARREEFHTETYQNQNNRESVTTVKRILNYFIAYEHREDVLNTLCEQFPAANLDSETFYLRPAELREMQDAGMILGSHSITHRVFSKLSQSAQRDEIISSFDYLSTVVDGLDVRTFCYPYGGFHTFTEYTRGVLDDAGCLFSFNVESRDIQQDDFQTQPQALPRYDCNEFRHGDASGGVNSHEMQ